MDDSKVFLFMGSWHSDATQRANCCSAETGVHVVVPGFTIGEEGTAECATKFRGGRSGCHFFFSRLLKSIRSEEETKTKTEKTLFKLSGSLATTE